MFYLDRTMFFLYILKLVQYCTFFIVDACMFTTTATKSCKKISMILEKKYGQKILGLPLFYGSQEYIFLCSHVTYIQVGQVREGSGQYNQDPLVLPEWQLAPPLSVRSRKTSHIRLFFLQEHSDCSALRTELSQVMWSIGSQSWNQFGMVSMHACYLQSFTSTLRGSWRRLLASNDQLWICCQLWTI